MMTTKDDKRHLHELYDLDMQTRIAQLTRESAFWYARYKGDSESLRMLMRGIGKLRKNYYRHEESKKQEHFDAYMETLENLFSLNDVVADNKVKRDEWT